MSIYSEIKPEVRMFADMCVENSRIDPELYLKYDVKRGLRDLNGKGVLTGLTNISEIISSKTVDGKSVPCEGELYYRGYRRGGAGAAASWPGTDFGYERHRLPAALWRAARRGTALRSSASCCPSTAPCPPALCGTSS